MEEEERRPLTSPVLEQQSDGDVPELSAEEADAAAAEGEPPPALTRKEQRKLARKQARDKRREDRADARSACEERLKKYDQDAKEFAKKQLEWKQGDESFVEEMRRIHDENRMYEEAAAERAKEKDQEAQRETRGDKSTNPWTADLFIPVLRPSPPADLRRVRLRLFLNQVEKIHVEEDVHLATVQRKFRTYAQDLGTDCFLSEDGFVKAMSKEFYSELTEMQCTQLFWRLGGEFEPRCTDGFLPMSGLAACLCKVLNNGNRLARALGAFERLVSPQEMYRHKAQKPKRGKGKKAKASSIDLPVPEQVSLMGVQSVERGEFIGGKANEPHPSRAHLASAALAIPPEKGGLPFRDGVLAILDFMTVLAESPAMFHLFLGPLLDSYLSKECSPDSEDAAELQ